MNLRHVVGFVFVADQRAIEGVDHDHRRRGFAELVADGGDQLLMVGDQIERLPDQIERDVLFAAIAEMLAAPCLDAVAESAAAFERAVDDDALPHRRPRYSRPSAMCTTRSKVQKLLPHFGGPHTTAKPVRGKIPLTR